MQKSTFDAHTHTHCHFRSPCLLSYRFLLVFEGGPKLLQFNRDRRAGQLQGFDDITSIANLILSDEGVGIALEEGTRFRDV